MRFFALKKTWFVFAGLIAASVGTACLLVAINLYYGWQAAEPATPFASAEYFDPFSNQEGDNVSGWAWNSNIGWISFNAANCDSEEPGDGTTDDGNFSNCPVGESIEDYGVNVNMEAADLGNFSGYAWSSNVGWISFQEDDPPDYDFNDDCHNSPTTCTAANHCTACYHYADEEVYGWAKILSLEDDAGWIKLNDGGWTGMTIDPATSKVTGWAWNEDQPENTGIGWISFSSDNPASAGGDYEVIAEVNTVPYADNLTAPNWNQANACPNVLPAPGYREARGAVLTWDFIDPDPVASGTAYQVTVTEEGGPDIIDTCKCNGLNSCAGGGDPADCRISLGCMSFDGNTCYYRLDSGDLDYDTSYEWEVTVWDNYDVSSTTKYYESDDSGVVPGTNAEDGNPETFTTYAHEFPDPSFQWFIPDPSAEEEVRFEDSSVYYEYGSPAADAIGTCSSSGGPGDACDQWDWTPTGGSLVTPNDQPEVIIKFQEAGDWGVDLTVTDKDGYFCSTSTSLSGGGSDGVEVKESLPGWKEVK